MQTAGKIDVAMHWMLRGESEQAFKISELSPGLKWSRQLWDTTLIDANVIGYYAAPKHESGRAVGYLIYKLRPASFEILNFGVHPAWTRCAIGRQLINRMKTKLSSMGRKRMYCRVPEDNLAAQVFLRSCGLKCIRIDESQEQPRYVMEFRLATR